MKGEKALISFERFLKIASITWWFQMSYTRWTWLIHWSCHWSRFEVIVTPLWFSLRCISSSVAWRAFILRVICSLRLQQKHDENSMELCLRHLEEEGFRVRAIPVSEQHPIYRWPSEIEFYTFAFGRELWMLHSPALAWLRLSASVPPPYPLYSRCSEVERMDGQSSAQWTYCKRSWLR